jgi:hypothetical protein
VVSLGLRSNVTQQIIQEAEALGGWRMGMNQLSVEMIQRTERWCQDNCRSEYIVDPYYQLQIFFSDPSEAMLFKLTHG